MTTIGTWNLENLFRPGEAGGPPTPEAYDAKLATLAATITRTGVDLLAVEEVGDPEALADLVARLGPQWTFVLSSHFAAGRPIRVGFVSRLPITVTADVADFPPLLPAVQTGDDPANSQRSMGRGALAVTVTEEGGAHFVAVACHLKSKLISYPGGRFSPKDEGERARFTDYALDLRAAEAVTVRALADQLLAGDGRTHPVVVMGDLNDGPEAATTQLLYGPPGNQPDTPAYGHLNKGDAARLWNLGLTLPPDQRCSRVADGVPEMIDHVLVSKALLGRVTSVWIGHDGPLPSVTGDPAVRAAVPASDHCPVLATLAA